jgi:RNA polymerase sigma factor (sigma-70 family)
MLKEATMSSNRVVYQNWIVEIGRDPAKLRKQGARGNSELISLDDLAAATISSEAVRRAITEQKNTEVIRHAVQKALKKLDEQGRDFITQFYFIGKTYRQISEQSGRPIHKLEALHKRTLKKLKKELSSFVREHFGIESRLEGNCPICRSSFLPQINRLIAKRNKTATWKPIIKTLREKYRLKITSPQVLVGHEKYHMR